RVVLGVLIVALAILLIFNYTTGKTAQENLSHEALSTATMDISRAKMGVAEMGEFFQMIQQRPMLDPRLINNDIERVVEMVRTNVSDAQKLLADALNSNDPSLKAQAEVQRGDGNMLLAAIPPLPGSTTRPTLNGERSK